MNFLIDIETAADPAPIAQDNFETIDAMLGHLFVQTATATVGNTGVITSFFGTGVGTRIIAGNSLRVGSVIKQRMKGWLTTYAGGSTQFTIDVLLGAVTKSFGTQLPGSSANGQWTLDVDWTVRTLGAAGTVIGQFKLIYEDGLGGEIIAYITPQTDAHISVLDTTANATVGAQVAWTLADVANTWNCTQATVRVV